MISLRESILNQTDIDSHAVERSIFWDVFEKIPRAKVEFKGGIYKIGGRAIQVLRFKDGPKKLDGILDARPRAILDFEVGPATPDNFFSKAVFRSTYTNIFSNVTSLEGLDITSTDTFQTRQSSYGKDLKFIHDCHIDTPILYIENDRVFPKIEGLTGSIEQFIFEANIAFVEKFMLNICDKTQILPHTNLTKALGLDKIKDNGIIRINNNSFSGKTWAFAKEGFENDLIVSLKKHNKPLDGITDDGYIGWAYGF